MKIIRDGYVVDVESRPVDVHRQDVLIHGDRILEVGPGLHAPDDAEVIDAAGRIVLPGFVDTHRHTWEAALRALLPDANLEHYLRQVVVALRPRYEPRDVYAAVLAGALECLDAGITTLLDWSSPVHLTPDHREAALGALRDAGIRTVVGLKADDVVDTNLARDPESALLTPAVTALAPELVDEDAVRRIWSTAREAGCLLTVHNGARAEEKAPLVNVGVLERLGVLSAPTLYVHANELPASAYGRIAGSGGAIAVCPSVETAMDHGRPATGAAREFGITAGLGADSVVAGPGDMFALMRLAYGLQRLEDKTFATGDVLRMATLGGAAALGLGEVTGSLRPGKQADVVVLRTDTLGMAAAHDPVAAVVHAADARAVDTVLVAGTVVKRDGVLLGHAVPDVVAGLAAAARRLTGR